jgi:hypothetical protein
MPKCKKCGASLHPEQKVCLDCGTQTDLWPGGPTVEEEPPVQIPWLPVGIIAGGLVVAMFLIVMAMHFRVVPPDQVADKWLSAVTSRNAKLAKEYTTPEFEAMLADRPMSAEKGDQYFEFMYNNEAKYSVSEPQMESPTSAVVTVTFNGNNGQTLTEQIHLERQGRTWKITLVV